MTPEERESLRPECVKSAPSQNLLGAGAAKELAIQHLFEQVSLKRELHVAGMLLRRGIARVSIAEAQKGQPHSEDSAATTQRKPMRALRVLGVQPRRKDASRALGLKAPHDAPRNTRFPKQFFSPDRVRS